MNKQLVLPPPLVSRLSKPLNRYGIPVLLLCILSVQHGCKKQALEKTNRQTETGRARSGKSDFKLTLSSGGGFTGLFKGFTLFSDGRVEHWLRDPSQKDSILWSAHVKPDEIKVFRQQLQRSGIFQETLRETGNMTTMVMYESPDSSHVWSWSSTGGAGNIPKKMSAWYESVQAFCQQVEKKVNGDW